MLKRLRKLFHPESKAPSASDCYPVDTLDEDFLRNCKVYPDRQYALKHVPHHAVVAEVGVWHGEYSEQILAVTNPSRLHLFDLHPKKKLKQRFASLDQVQLHEGDSSTELAKFPDHHFDWIYIDADHSLAGVTKDIAVAKNKIKPAGLLIFNDYTVWSHLEGMPYGVPMAVNRLCKADGFEFVYLALNAWGYHDVAVRRRGC